MEREKKVLIAMSGGVDSSVAAYLARQAGLFCVGGTMCQLPQDDGRNTADARAVAEKLGMEFYAFDLREKFREAVVERFIAAYERGWTPNPCVECNRNLKFEALFQKASKLPRVDIVRPDKAIGTNTVMSMQSGAVRGYAGAIQGIVGEMQEEMGCKCNVVATGGMGRMMAQYCDIITHVDANLTLEGLLMIYQANKEKFDAVEPLGTLCVSADEEIETRL